MKMKRLIIKPNSKTSRNLIRIIMIQMTISHLRTMMKHTSLISRFMTRFKLIGMMIMIKIRLTETMTCHIMIEIFLMETIWNLSRKRARGEEEEKQLRYKMM